MPELRTRTLQFGSIILTGSPPVRGFEFEEYNSVFLITFALSALSVPTAFGVAHTFELPSIVQTDKSQTSTKMTAYYTSCKCSRKMKRAQALIRSTLSHRYGRSQCAYSKRLYFLAPVHCRSPTTNAFWSKLGRDRKRRSSYTTARLLVSEPSNLPPLSARSFTR